MSQQEEPLPEPQHEAPAETAAATEERQYVFDKQEEPKSFWHLFIPRGNFFVTPVIIWLNIAVYIIMVASGIDFFAPESQDLIAWGGNFKPLVLGGEWWRLFSCMFLHFGILHLALNMYALFYVGVYLEPLLGRTKFAIAYLAAGLLSSVASTWWHGNDIVGAGASGAIFGMYGVFLALLTTHVVDRHARQSLLASVGVFVAYNLFYGLTSKEIDNSAHIGGLTAGFIIGYILFLSFREPSPKKDKTISAIIASAAILIAFLYIGIGKNDNARFDQQLNSFIQLQNKAMEAQSDTTGGDSQLEQRLKNVALPAWNAAKQAMDATSAYKLDAVHIRKRELATRLADLHIQQMHLILKIFGASEDEVRQYQEQSQELVGQMNSVVEEMNKL